MIRLFNVSVPSSVLALILSEAALVFACYVVAAYWVLDFSADIFLLEAGGLWRIALVATLIVLGLYFNDLYESFRIRSRLALLQQYCLVLGVAFLAQAILSYGRWDVILPKWMMVYGSFGVLLLVPAWRIIFAGAMGRAFGAQRLLFLGCSQAAREIMENLRERPELGLLPVGYLAERESGDHDPEGAPRLGTFAEFDGVVAEQHPDRVVVALRERRETLPVDRLLELRFKGVHVEDDASLYESVFGRISTRDMRPSELVFSSELGPRIGKVIFQSLYSWILGLIGILITSPLMLIVALAVRFSSPGPMLYRQTRVGRNGRLFTLYKFRSMYQDAEAATGAVWAVKDDPRVTPVGRWLRKMRLDELPQLFNVVKGDMSIVGPRPERPEFVEMLEQRTPYYRQRLCVKPGVTGWAQINHKYGDTIEDAITKLEYDLYYIKNMATSLDAYIVFHTVKTVLLGRGAQ
ncbi:MAG TPA: sugar transferase [Bryobacteraceae bacterium]|nr:sugar transferase [Bryobacteraceae bacterium]